MDEDDLRTITIQPEFISPRGIVLAEPIYLHLPYEGSAEIARRRLLITQASGRVVVKREIWHIRQAPEESQQKFRPRIDGLLRVLMISSATDLQIEEARNALTGRQRRSAARKRPFAPPRTTSLETWVTPDGVRISGATFHVSSWADEAIAKFEAEDVSWHEIDWSGVNIKRRYIFFSPDGTDAQLADYAERIQNCMKLQDPKVGRVKGPPL